MKIIHVIVLASVKYILMLPYALIIGLDYKQALLAVLLGGIGGFLFFYYLSKKLSVAISFIRFHLCKFCPPTFKTRCNNLLEKKRQRKPRKMFSRKNRMIARFRSTYGFWGIILATPVLLTIPVGAFLANKYYSKRRHTVLYMILSITGWAGVLSGVVHLFPKIFF